MADWMNAEGDLCPNCLHLIKAVESRDLIGQAKGILMERHRCSAEHAFEMLVEWSQKANKKLVHVAAAVVDSVASRGDIPQRRAARNTPSRFPRPRATSQSPRSM